MSGNKDFKYGAGSVAIGTGLINLLTANVQAMLVSALYAPQPNTDAHVSDIPIGAIIARDKALTGLRLNSSGVFSGTIPTFNSLVSSSQVVGVVLYVNSGLDSTSQLLYYSSTGPGFPFLPQGFQYVVGFDQSNGGFFQV